MPKHQDAPGGLEHVRAFVNTVDIEPGTERLEAPEQLAAWLAESGLAAPDLRASSRDLVHAIALREALRAILLTHNDGTPVPAPAAATLDQAALRARLRLRFDARGTGTLEPAASGADAALGRLLSIVHAATADGTWARLKACREHTCEWAFFDHTKNRSGTWCNMAVCGNRAKARAYRERRGDPSPSS